MDTQNKGRKQEETSPGVAHLEQLLPHYSHESNHKTHTWTGDLNSPDSFFASAIVFRLNMSSKIHKFLLPSTVKSLKTGSSCFVPIGSLIATRTNDQININFFLLLLEEIIVFVCSTLFSLSLCECAFCINTFAFAFLFFEVECWFEK